jgi:hypothetical protein
MTLSQGSIKTNCFASRVGDSPFCFCWRSFAGGGWTRFGTLFCRERDCAQHSRPDSDPPPIPKQTRRLASREGHPLHLLFVVKPADFFPILVPWLNEKGIDLE